MNARSVIRAAPRRATTTAVFLAGRVECQDPRRTRAPLAWRPAVQSRAQVQKCQPGNKNGVRLIKFRVRRATVAHTRGRQRV